MEILMNTRYKDIAQRCQVFGLMALYLFVTLSYIFFLSSTTITGDNNAPNYKVTSVKDTHGKNYVQRTDKAVFKENKKGSPKYTALHGHNDLFIAKSAVTWLHPLSRTSQTSFARTGLFILHQNLRI